MAERIAGTTTPWYYIIDGDSIFSRTCCDRMMGSHFTLKEGRFKLDKGKHFYSEDGEALPREVVGAPSLEIFKVRTMRL